jgi:hypothetical protein
MAGQRDFLSALPHSDRTCRHSGWSEAISRLRALDWHDDQGGGDVVCNTLDTQMRIADQGTRQVTGQSPTNLTCTRHRDRWRKMSAPLAMVGVSPREGGLGPATMRGGASALSEWHPLAVISDPETSGS